MTSRIPGFYRLAPADRLDAVSKRTDLAAHHRRTLSSDGLSIEAADMMVENVISTFALPNAVAVNFTINGVDRLIPMVVEEPSVVAAVSNVAKICRASGGFTADSEPGVMIGQIQLGDVSDPEQTAQALRDALPDLEALALDVHPRLIKRGGGLRGFEVRTPTYDEPGQPVEHMVVLHVLLDCVDAMGANMVNTLCEALAPKVAEITGYPVGLRILSNLADRRVARASVRLRPEQIATANVLGPEVARRIAASWRFAWSDPYRAATHNKGVMNGVDAVCLATGNDWRAVEAGAHAYCARDGQYRPMTRWFVDAEGQLNGSIEIPLQLGTVGGTTKVHPTVQANLAILGNPGARDLAGICAAVGLAQNLGALRALTTVGIQQGHMRMHARSVAANAGADNGEVAHVVDALVSAGDFSIAHASRILTEMRSSK